ncbi:MAG: DUF2577 family protein [Oribacterium sp.]|nr:DUF2577 family protein [Oribacterium sp.]
MSWKEDMISMMREQGERNNPTGIQLATMTSANTAMIGNLPLLSQDLLFSDRLLQPTATKVAGHCPADGELTDKSNYLPALKAGDIVAVYCIEDKSGYQKYLVLERMVSV